MSQQPDSPRRPGAQPGNRNALADGAFSRHEPATVGALTAAAGNAITARDPDALFRLARAIRDRARQVEAAGDPGHGAHLRDQAAVLRALARAILAKPRKGRGAKHPRPEQRPLPEPHYVPMEEPA